jgi:hypothetical protein
MNEKMCDSFDIKLSLQAVWIVAVQLCNNRSFLGRNPETQGGAVDNAFKWDFKKCISKVASLHSVVVNTF